MERALRDKTNQVKKSIFFKNVKTWWKVVPENPETPQVASKIKSGTWKEEIPVVNNLTGNSKQLISSNHKIISLRGHRDGWPESWDHKIGQWQWVLSENLLTNKYFMKYEWEEIVNS